jgi:hypothetical protein
MDLEAPRDEVLAQKDQANTAFLLHGYGLGRRAPTARPHTSLGHRPREKSPPAIRAERPCQAINIRSFKKRGIAAKESELNGELTTKYPKYANNSPFPFRVFRVFRG